MLNDFIEYLKRQVGQPYVWGGQHTKLTPENYVRTIEKKEAGRGAYSDGQSYVDAATEFCRRKFAAGATVLYAYDCSGLGCYWLYNLKHLYRGDVNANTMMGRCNLKPEPPQRGWWVFRLNGKRASHIGYMIDDQYLIEAKGRKYGVVKTKFQTKDWHKWGIPAVFANEINILEPIPPDPGFGTVKVIGKSVNVRNADSTKGKILFTAHSERWYREHGEKKESDSFPLVSISKTGWYQVKTIYPEAFISNRADLTKVVER